MKYIFLKNIEVRKANAMPAWWVTGFPSMTAFDGFAHKLALDCGIEGHEGVAVIEHGFQYRANIGKFKVSPHLYRSSQLIDKDDRASGSFSSSTIPVVLSDIKVSIVICVSDDFDRDEAFLHNYLRGARIAGGDVFLNKYSKIVVVNHQDDEKITQGFSIVDRHDLLASQNRESGEDVLDAFLRVTRRIAGENHAVHGWLSPTCAGYARISETIPQARARSGRDGAPLNHCFVEPLVGLIEFRSVKHGLHFWKRHATRDLFVLTA